MQTLVVMALKAESQGLFEAAGYPVFYCGVGPIKATFQITKLLLEKKPKRVINIGTAGSHKYKQGQLVECISFVQRVPHGSLGFPSQEIKTTSITHLPSVICGSGNFIEQGPPVTPCDIFDMEAYALAFVCQNLNTPFNSIKYVSDSSDQNVIQDWQKNVGQAAQALLNLLLLVD